MYITHAMGMNDSWCGIGMVNIVYTWTETTCIKCVEAALKCYPGSPDLTRRLNELNASTAVPTFYIGVAHPTASTIDIALARIRELESRPMPGEPHVAAFAVLERHRPDFSRKPVSAEREYMEAMRTLKRLFAK